MPEESAKKGANKTPAPGQSGKGPEEGFEPKTKGTQDCEEPSVSGTPSVNYDYIAKHGTDDSDSDLTELFGDHTPCTPYYYHNTRIGDLQVDEDIAVVGNITAATASIPSITGTASGNKTLAAFDIPHAKKKSTRIRHIVAEGPEPGIYIRGKLEGTNIIELPEYWDGLVDPDTITVTLTQIGTSQDLIIQEISGSVVILKSGTGERIHCFYEVWAARWLNPMNHDEKLHVVYEGETPDDYPGGNENFLIGGWDYDRRNPQWETPE